MSLYLLTKLKNELFSITKSRNYLIALSGGIDSCILLQILKNIREHNKINIRAIYLNHNVSKRSHYWLHYCEKLCEKLSIPLVAISILKNFSSKIPNEDDLSTLRYQIFSKHLLKHEILLTAHTKDDQIESILMQLIRGSGTKGVTGIPLSRIISGKIQRRCFFYLHIRPFLSITRSNLLDYARTFKIKWIEDESNFSDVFSRNYLRIHVVPIIKSRWGYKFMDILPRTSIFFTKAEIIFFRITECNFHYVSNRISRYCNESFKLIPNTFSIKLNIKKLVKLDQKSRWRVICYWLRKYKCRILSIKELFLLEKVLILKKESKLSYSFSIDDYFIKKDSNFLFLSFRKKSLVFFKHSLSYLWNQWKAFLSFRYKKILNICLNMGFRIVFYRRSAKKTEGDSLKRVFFFLKISNRQKNHILICR